MSESTSIAWTDATFNPWWGCTAVSIGCDNCYAETFDKRYGGDHWGKGKPRRTFSDKHWDEPIKWDKAAKEKGVKTKVFCGSMCDIMDDECPDGARYRLWELIDSTPNLIWQLLTKRPHRYERYLPSSFLYDNNVWLGTTCEDQNFYDIRWPILSAIRNKYGLSTFISYEPALGPLTLKKHAHIIGIDVPDWIIFGGETGNKPRPMEQSWAENIKQECSDNGVSFFMKQMSARTPTAAANLIPEHLLVRQFPEVS